MSTPSAPSPRSGRRVGVSLRRDQAAWYARREQLHIERAKLRAAILVDLASELASGDARSAEIAEEMVRNVMWNGHDSFTIAGRELAETAGNLPSARPLIEWYATADARLGEYPR